MFTYLYKYKDQGKYVLKKGDSHTEICDAPKNGRGVYAVFCGEEVLFISCSGLIKANSNEPKVREADGGGLWARITRGKLPGFHKERIHEKLVSENVGEITIKWWITYDKSHQDNPKDIRNLMIVDYTTSFGVLPSWNRK